MHRLWATVVVFLFLEALAFAQTRPGFRFEAPNGGVIYSFEGETIATNGVIIKYGDAVMTADKAKWNEKTGEVTAEGNIALHYQGHVWVGQSIKYNFLTGKIVAENFKTKTDFVFSRSSALVGNQKANVYVGANSLITTDDYDQPSYGIRAKSIVVVPGEYVEARQATLLVGDVPILYLPKYRHSLKVEGSRFEMTPGYRSAYGPFLLTRYHYFHNEDVDASFRVDGREKRGIGVGPDFDYDFKRWGEGKFKGYYAYDLDPGKEGTNSIAPDEDRYRIWFGHKANPLTNLEVTAVARYQSDAGVIHDFFESEYRQNVQPSTFLEVDKTWSNWSVDAMAQPSIVHFWDTVERLPDVKVTGLRQQIGGSPLYYESDSSLGYYKRRFADGSTNEIFSAMRADTFHQIVLPETYFDWLTVIPRVGGRFTHYEEASGPGATTDEQDRGVFNTGVEFTTKASQVWPGVESKFWQMDGLRHIIEPSINYAYVPNPTVSPRLLPQFDYEVQTTRLLPIEFPDFNAIDAIDSQNVLRLGLRNKLQTKRNGQVENFLHWSLVTDWRLTRNSSQSTFSDVYSQADFRPFSWLSLSSDIRYGVENRSLNEAIHRLTLTPNTTWSASIGHRYLREDPQLGITDKDDLLLTTLYYRLSENWCFRAAHQYQARDGTLEEQAYTIYRDFRSWTGALTFRVRDNRVGPKDYTVAFTFSLKAVPRYNANDERVRPSMLMGY